VLHLVGTLSKLDLQDRLLSEDIMVFKKKCPETGEYDKNQNISGRINKREKPSARKIKEQELVSLIRKLKPNLALAISTVVGTMKDEKSTEAGKLKAAALMLTYYKQLVESVYDIDIVPDIEGNESPKEIDSTPKFSLHMLETNTKKEE
jgi:hypothetical protein